MLNKRQKYLVQVGTTPINSRNLGAAGLETRENQGQPQCLEAAAMQNRLDRGRYRPRVRDTSGPLCLQPVGMYGVPRCLSLGGL
jgi:hypothetical protein